MLKETKQKLDYQYFWIKNKSLKPLLFILLLEVMIILHQAGILVMVR